MKKIAFLLIAVFGMTFISCNTKKDKETVAELSAADSLQQIVSQKDKELVDMMTTMNDIRMASEKSMKPKVVSPQNVAKASATTVLKSWKM